MKALLMALVIVVGASVHAKEESSCPYRKQGSLFDKTVKVTNQISNVYIDGKKMGAK